MKITLFIINYNTRARRLSTSSGVIYKIVKRLFINSRTEIRTDVFGSPKPACVSITAEKM